MPSWKTCFAATVLLLPALAACDETPVTLPEPTSVSVAATDLRMTVGDVAAVTGQVLDQEGSVLQLATPTYSSDNPGVAAVDGGGMVRAVSPGSANVTVAYGNLKATARVTVTREERGQVQSLDVLVDSVAFDVRAGAQAVSLRAFNGYGQPVCPAVTVRSSDASVAQGASAGSCRVSITPIIAGTATLTVQADGARDSVRVRVTSEGALVFVSARPPAAEIYAGNTGGYTVRLMDAQERPLANRLVRFDVTAGSLSATSGTTDASGAVTVQWTLPTDLRTLGSTHTFFVRTLLPNGLVGGWNETVTVTAAPLVSMQLYRWTLYAFEPITGSSIAARVYDWNDLAAGGVDQYGNTRGDGFTFTVSPPAGTCGTFQRGGLSAICVQSYSTGTSTFTATHSSGLSRSVNIVFGN